MKVRFILIVAITIAVLHLVGCGQAVAPYGYGSGYAQGGGVVVHQRTITTTTRTTHGPCGPRCAPSRQSVVHHEPQVLYTTPHGVMVPEQALACPPPSPFHFQRRPIIQVNAGFRGRCQPPPCPPQYWEGQGGGYLGYGDDRWQGNPATFDPLVERGYYYP